MSRKTELKADLKRVGYQLGDAHLTRQARDATFNTFARTMRELNYGIQNVHQIGGRHLKAFVQHRAAQGVSPRTIANEMGHLRAVLMHIGKEGLALNPAYCRATIRMTKRDNQDDKILEGRFRAFRLGFDPPGGDFGLISVRLVGDRGRWGMQEVFHVTEYLPHARSTHQRSPDEAVHEIQTD